MLQLVTILQGTVHKPKDLRAVLDGHTGWAEGSEHKSREESQGWSRVLWGGTMDLEGRMRWNGYQDNDWYKYWGLPILDLGASMWSEVPQDNLVMALQIWQQRAGLRPINKWANEVNRQFSDSSQKKYKLPINTWRCSISLAIMQTKMTCRLQNDITDTACSLSYVESRP
jgi:hypothetical protein